MIFHNPVKGRFIFGFGFLENTDGTIVQVINLAGSIVLTKNLGLQVPGFKQFGRALSHLVAGIYLLESVTGKLK